MAISQAEAATALRDIEQTTARATEMRAYSYASPHLLLWGVVWVLGYGAMGYAAPRDWGLIWVPLDLVGVVGSAVIAARARARASAGAVDSGAFSPVAMLMALLFTALFVVCTFTVCAPARPEPYLVFPALVLGLVYVVAGVWKMQRLAWIGAAISTLTMAGYVFMAPWLGYWIAAVGGGGLILGGLWLRKI